MLHIVFNASDISLINEMMKLDESLAGKAIQIKDDFAVGPISGIDTEDGWKARTNWWRDLLLNSPYENDTQTSFDDRETVKHIKEVLDTDAQEQAWIWMGQNQHDVCGYYWFIQYFKHYQGRVFVIYLNNLPFINERGQLFYPSWMHEIRPKELLKAKKLSRPVTLSELEIDPDEWKRLCNENSIVRTLEGGKKIIGQSESFYDADILKNLNSEWQKATRVLTNTLHRMKIKTGDVFLMWRMKELIRQGKIEILGDMKKAWKEFDVKLPGSRAHDVEAEATSLNME